MDFLQQMSEQARVWADAQNQAWSQWLEQLQTGQSPSGGAEVWKQGVELWESAVKGVLDNQSESLERWLEQARETPGAPEQMTRFTEEGAEMMSRFIGMQRDMWDQWFALLSGGGPAGFDLSKLSGEGAGQVWREMGEQMMRLQSDWLAAMSGGAAPGGKAGQSKPARSKK